MKNYYDTLGVAKEANEQEIKSAYRKLSLKYHPDRNPDDKVAEDKFKEVNEAYQTLGTAEKRQAYDLGSSQPHTGGFDVNDILRNMGFNIDFSQGNPFMHQGSQKIQFRHQINLSLHDAVFGCDVGVDVPSYINCKDCAGIGGAKTTCHQCKGIGQTLSFLGTMKIPVTCVACNGQGYVLSSTCQSCNQEGYKKKTRHLKIKIPAGIQNQSALHIGSDPNDRCDVFLIINVMKHPKINRNGNLLFSTENISCFDAILGGKCKVETIDGYADLIIPAGAQQGQQLNVDSVRVNHIINVNIEIPTNLSPEQIKDLQKINNKIKKS